MPSLRWGRQTNKPKAAASSVPASEYLATKADIADLKIAIVTQFKTLYRYLLGYAAAIVAAIVAIDRFLG